MNQQSEAKHDSNSDYETDDDDIIDESDPTYFESSDDSLGDSNDEEESDECSPIPTVPTVHTVVTSSSIDRMEKIEWTEIPNDYVPRKEIPEFKEPIISSVYDENCNEFEAFLAIFPKSLFMWISTCTNERLKLFAEEKGREIPPTDYQELMLVIGVTLMMSYNRVPHMAMYWSKNKSLRNEAIASAISRDRFLLIASKLYFNTPQKPDGAGKTYYMDELVNCLMYTFNRARSEATFQSIDEAMIKFEGRSTMKQFMKDKPVDRGVKGWVRADAKKGYVYDFRVYSGKEVQIQEGTLGERVVNSLCTTIREPDVAVIIDRFFTSVHLQQTISFPCVGTVISNRRNLPQLTNKLERGDSQAMCTKDGVICYKWSDTKEFLLLSNCHKDVIATCERKQKDGTKKTFKCPEAINFYNEFMAGVDRSDQYSTTYEVDRKSNKWWKRVFYRLLMISVTNTWILFKEVKKKDITLINFLIPLAEHVTAIGKSGAKHKRKANTGRPSKRSKLMVNVGHQPVHGETLRRCSYCAKKKFRVEVCGFVTIAMYPCV